ncbi:MAG TPA: hypothetical protein VFE58_11920 [Tepidisphaeraceae bacterium]|jgi:hypothetical protein|nr:hypothetical protein [Tepidisphaeraceae bacterium]
MPTANDFPAHGKILSVRAGVAIFNPANTNYEIHLSVPPDFTGPLNTPVQVIIHVTARKVWTVPSGGNFVAPIFGPPKIIQGRLRHASDTELIVHAGTTFAVKLDPQQTAIELPDGAMSILNNLINITALPGATLELLSARSSATSVA